MSGLDWIEFWLAWIEFGLAWMNGLSLVRPVQNDWFGLVE
jgi:hypothetical protein